jgi:pimeloyl-ACP methyl ester carboxylesterase
MDTKPTGSEFGTVVAVHGAPGSHKDFKYIYPELDGVRFVGINWPSMGYSDYDHSLVDTNEERVQIVQQIVDELKLENVVFMGHSRGSENALKMAALNQEKAAGLILLNPIGLQPHKGVHPYFFIRYMAWVWKTFPFTHFIYNRILFFVYEKIGLRAFSGNSAGVCLNLMRNADFKGQQAYIDKLNDGDVRVLNCFSGKDFLVETSVSEELGHAFSDIILTCSTEDDSQLEVEMQKNLQDGNDKLSICFEKDGHFLQKTRAGFLARTIKFLLSGNNNKE